ncbi:GIY-YIG nuclease family protein [Patescibacteria group bacterium]
MTKTPYYVYILECADGSFYTGITNNINNRIKRHNSGKGSKYTRARLPVKLLYKEKYNSYKLAFRREIEIKGWRREKKEKLIKGKK